MPSPVLKAVAIFTRDLLEHPDESLIVIGRENYDVTDFTTEYIVIDALGQMGKVGNMEDYDGDTEKLAIGAVWRGPVTLDFHGNDAYSRAIEYGLLARSQRAYELKQTLGVNIFHSSGPTDLKFLTGEQYSNRVQIELQIEYTHEVIIDTLRIDTAQIEIRTEKGVQTDG